ncbi:MAG: hypothetical protein ACHQ17_03980 [Polyangia bacterium]|jgi:hypothetical protein
MAQAVEAMVEVFRCTDEGLAQMAIDVVLGPQGITGRIHDRISRMIPVPGSMAGAYFIAVPESQAQEAVRTLRQAQADGALSDDGQVI